MCSLNSSNRFCFPPNQTLSDICGFHWTICVLGNGLEVSLPPASLARKRFNVWDLSFVPSGRPVEALEESRAYITKTNIQHFRRLHHKNRIALVDLSCTHVQRRYSICYLNQSDRKGHWCMWYELIWWRGIIRSHHICGSNVSLDKLQASLLLT